MLVCTLRKTVCLCAPLTGDLGHTISAKGLHKSSPNQSSKTERIHDQNSRRREFQLVREKVYVRNYTGRSTSVASTIVGIDGAVIYRIQLADGKEIRLH